MVTRVVLTHMYSALSRGGHIIVDDYDWRPEKHAKQQQQGEGATRKICKHAADEFRTEHNISTPITRQYIRPLWVKQQDTTRNESYDLEDR